MKGLPLLYGPQTLAVTSHGETDLLYNGPLLASIKRNVSAVSSAILSARFLIGSAIAGFDSRALAPFRLPRG
jgi:hypothetical protein